MANLLLSPQPIAQNTALAMVRIITGAFMIYHGSEMFDRKTMLPYMDWDVIKSLPAPETMLYIGKGLELFSGICFVLGFLTRIAALIMAIDMLFICFKIGEGRFYYEDQHPFLFAMIALVFFFTGPVKWALDKVLFEKR